MSLAYFNARYYLYNNPDVADALGWSEEAAEQHYLAYGASEALAGGAARAPNPWFDIQYYAANNPDLLAAGLSGSDLYMHFVNYGMAEGRIPSANVRDMAPGKLQAYARDNQDITINLGITDINNISPDQSLKLLNHYYAYGYQEDRKSTPFSPIPDIPVFPGTTDSDDSDFQLSSDGQQLIASTVAYWMVDDIVASAQKGQMMTENQFLILTNEVRIRLQESGLSDDQIRNDLGINNPYDFQSLIDGFMHTLVQPPQEISSSLILHAYQPFLDSLSSQLDDASFNTISQVLKDNGFNGDTSPYQDFSALYSLVVDSAQGNPSDPGTISITPEEASFIHNAYIILMPWGLQPPPLTSEDVATLYQTAASNHLTPESNWDWQWDYAKTGLYNIFHSYYHRPSSDAGSQNEVYAQSTANTDAVSIQLIGDLYDPVLLG